MNTVQKPPARAVALAVYPRVRERMFFILKIIIITIINVMYARAGISLAFDRTTSAAFCGMHTRLFYARIYMHNPIITICITPDTLCTRYVHDISCMQAHSIMCADGRARARACDIQLTA